ncbi:MAG: FAD-dependent oxidoreductase [Anaerolineales bacterium]|nr:FAD-dependent oxidoreductase [Chloroflexota bacterium]MBL6980872.1 FAD-dependent oxidoreductase [Anaerolineales bacterium]
MNRRDFLKIIALLGNTVAASRCDIFDEKNETILVVGAGISGLSAAHTLQKWGYKVIVLEARSRIGGRIWTSREWADAPLDLGASWIHGIRNNPISKLAKDNQIEVLETDYDNHWIYGADGNELSDSEYESLDDILYSVQEYIFEAIEELDNDVSLQTIVENAFAEADISPAERASILYLINSVIEHDYAADSKDLSALYLDEGEEFGGEDVIFPGGYDQIINLLAEGLDIRLDEVVQNVEHGNQGVSITTNQNKYQADKVVITLPLGVLKSGNVLFSPALPKEKQNAIHNLGMGLLDKVCLRFPNKFWPQGPELLGFISENTGEWAEWLNVAFYKKMPILMGFNAAAFAHQTESWSDQQIVEGAMGTLRKMFGADIPDPGAWQITRWAADPYALGSYSYNKLGATPESHDELAAPVGTRLFFAGEATSREYNATVHGAYLSGLRAAEEIWDA